MAKEEGTSVEPRQRKKQRTSGSQEAKAEKIRRTPAPERAPKYVSFQRFAKIVIGCLAAVISGMMHVFYLSAYHERKFWFSNRQELEREITFQGDSAIYYSYYKDMLKAPSFERGVYELTHNNKTISLKTINAMQQMSLYPELIASVLYQATGSNGGHNKNRVLHSFKRKLGSTVFCMPSCCTYRLFKKKSKYLCRGTFMSFSHQNLKEIFLKTQPWLRMTVV